MSKARKYTTEQYDALRSVAQDEYDVMVVDLHEVYGNVRAIARNSDFPRTTVARRLNAMEERLGDAVAVPEARILVFDIETAPMISYTWGLWKQTIGINMIEENTYIMTWAAKWLGEKEIMSDALINHPERTSDEDDGPLLQGIWKLMDEADFVVAHNGNGFDIRRLNTQFILAGMPPPSPYKSIDTLQIAKRYFGFTSNKLEYIAQRLLGHGKMDAGGMETWINCIKGDKEAWAHMLKYNEQDVQVLEDVYLALRGWDILKYNEQDVQVLEDVYLALRGWDKAHPSVVMATGPREGELLCTTCGSDDLELVQGKSVDTAVSKFDLFTCNACGSHMRGRTNRVSQVNRPAILVKAR